MVTKLLMSFHAQRYSIFLIKYKNVLFCVLNEQLFTQNLFRKRWPGKAFLSSLRIFASHLNDSVYLSLLTYDARVDSRDLLDHNNYLLCIHVSSSLIRF